MSAPRNYLMKKIVLTRYGLHYASIYENLVNFFITEIEETPKMGEEAISSDISIINFDDFFSKIRIFEEACSLRKTLLRE